MRHWRAQPRRNHGANDELEAGEAEAAAKTAAKTAEPVAPIRKRSKPKRKARYREGRHWFSNVIRAGAAAESGKAL